MNEYIGIDKKTLSKEKQELVKQYEDKLKGIKTRMPLLIFYNFGLIAGLSIYFRNISFLLKRYRLNIKNSRTSILFILFNFLAILGVTIIPNAFIMYRHPIRYFRDRKRIEDLIIENSEMTLENIIKSLEDENERAKLL
jgi:hypothetical protein